ncbi:hypothetical protein [Muricoccus nepalensis]
MLNDGQYVSIIEMAEAERLDRGYVGRLLQLTLLAPEIVEAILNGCQPAGLRLADLLEPIGTDWQGHRLLAGT